MIGMPSDARVSKDLEAKPDASTARHLGRAKQRLGVAHQSR
jgi:hypothetical protein